ncbi:hypothetical protein A3L11_02595 [Thermococcus siculi]|uniref:Uncharacterized protein n=1 Tax=Thermococcus siculi TaxID=72803 RepID=A0A2Z2MIC3_9EURY|nr:hypothetical protein A3L11_02595 [Thermococcus siculi]
MIKQELYPQDRKNMDIVPSTLRRLLQPTFHEQFVEYLFTALMNDEKLKRDLQGFNRFWVKLEGGGRLTESDTEPN